ncbi:MAG TPA: GDP-mannose 4,6-dehydratase [Anaerohalosphaeraceae bacterium]|nr:GDP-mannose 4,6-dehydratase [Anaerohalosphaeraceae bacterium]HOL89819.1 GDP-mannose 4,6-dehydratase [Anaerohalosphaeraceae bacterium]HPP56504.1 GDP-mannose 4,6-dehydratase [Anaerohalosphaeraceae bacterium]
MHYLITGGAGFIGSHLAESLLLGGHTVTVIDDLSTGNIRNIQALMPNPCFRFVYDSVRNEGLMNQLAESCDVIVHLAAAVGVRLIVERPVHTIETNIHGTEVVLAAANRFRKKVLLASTSEVYGKSEAIPFHEDDDTVLGSTRFSRWSYACSKAIDEFLGLAYHQQYGLPVIIVRLFNTVGPRQTGQYGMVIPRFVERALRNEPLEIYGSGKQTRCFCCVFDVVRALEDLLNCPSACGQVFNLGSDEEVSIEELADRVIAMTQSRSVKVFRKYEEVYGRPFDDMIRRVPSLERIRQAIHFQPTYTLSDTLRLIIEEMKGRLNAHQG